jgi:hypothetical protein
VRCPDGKVVAYALVPSIGDLWTLDYVLGHGDHLNSGIMYLLMAHVIEEKFELAKTAGNPKWIMYDTWLAASAGLRQFKAVLGFSPYWAGGGPDRSSSSFPRIEAYHAARSSL